MTSKEIANPVFRCLLLAVLFVMPEPETSSAEVARVTTVGMAGKIDQLVLPGTELESLHAEDRGVPLVLRIAKAWPHGSAFRYDLVYYGLEPGKHDLAKYLRRKDGSSTADLPEIEVEVRPVLPPGQVEPQPLPSRGTPSLGGYRAFLQVGVALWFAGLFMILLVGRRIRRDRDANESKPRSIADRLRPLVDGAIKGAVSTGQLAELERTLIAYWRRRLGLHDLKSADLFAQLRRHEEAGPLLEQLERWLHHPASQVPVDVTSLLRPYRDLPACDLDQLAKEGRAT